MGNPKGFFKRILVLDAETTGLAFDSVDPSYNTDTDEEYQAVSWGMVVADADTLKPIDSLYIEIKWNGESKWDMKAQAVHGLDPEYLEEHGMTEEEAACEIGTFVLKHFGPDSLVPCAGHNAATFDMFFLRRLMNKFGIMFRTGNRVIDTHSVGFTAYGTFTSDALFDLMGVKRGTHNALDDAKASLKVLYNTRRIYNSLLGDD